MPIVQKSLRNPWRNEHQTVEVQIGREYEAFNLGSANPFVILKGVASDFEAHLAKARESGKTARPHGTLWALTDIAAPSPGGWATWTSNTLNGLWNLSEAYRHPSYPAMAFRNLMIAQCGASIGSLNDRLEAGRRAFKTSGIGNGQSIAGATAGNTHGSAVRFGSTPDYLVGIQLVIGRGKSIWLERASQRVLADRFATDLGATLIADDEIFAATQVSFGAFGVIAAVAFEAAPIYHLDFTARRHVTEAQLATELRSLAQVANSDDTQPYHYEFVFNPYDKNQLVVAAAKKVPYSGHIVPKGPPYQSPRFSTDGAGLIPSGNLPAWVLKLPIPEQIAKWQWGWYLENALLQEWKGTPGQVFDATAQGFTGVTETAFAVSIDRAMATMGIISRVVTSEKIPSMCQARVVHPTNALLGFTRHAPKTVVFELAMAKGGQHARFETALKTALRMANIPYTFHWSKNSGLTRLDLEHMYGKTDVERWMAARDQIFGGDRGLKGVFDNDHLRRGGLA